MEDLADNTPATSSPEPVVKVGTGKETSRRSGVAMFVNRWAFLCFGLAFGGIGSYLLFAGHADTTTHYLYQFYKSGDHVYSTSSAVHDTLLGSGWSLQRSYRFSNDGSDNQAPIYRMRNNVSGHHLLLAGSNQLPGWTSQGVELNGISKTSPVPYGYCRQGWVRYWKGQDNVYTPILTDYTYYHSHGYEKSDSYVFYTDYACATNPAPTYMSPSAAVPNAGSSLGLNETGTVIPDSAYKVGGCDVTASSCAHAIFMAPDADATTGAAPVGSDANLGTKGKPVATLNRAIALANDGDTIVVRAGVYHDEYTDVAGNPAVLDKSLSFQAYPHEQVWFDGTDTVPAGKWTADNAGHWYTTWKTPTFCAGSMADGGATGYYKYQFTNQAGSDTNADKSNTGPCAHFDNYGDPANPAAGDPQMVFVSSSTTPNPVNMHEVTSLSATTSGNFFYDWAAKRLYISSDPATHTIELASRPTALQTDASGVNVRGLGFRRYATNEFPNTTNGAVRLAGDNAVLENDVFTQMAGAGVGGSTALNSSISHSVFAYNGFNGLVWNGSRAYNANVDNLLLEDNVFNANNTELFGSHCTVSCNNANVKMAHMNGATIHHNVFENGRGNASGYWCDIGCQNVMIVNNLSQNNGGAGILYEVSNTGIIASNMVVNNALTNTDVAGIYSDSANTKIWNNTVIGSTKPTQVGINVFDDERDPSNPTSPDVGPSTINVSMGNNVVDTNSFGLTSTGPDTITGLNKAPNTGADQIFSYLDYNAYFVPSGPVLGVIKWRPIGTSDATAYKALTSFVAAKSWEANGIATYSVPTGTLPFTTDSAHGNYAVPSGSSAYHTGTTIPADVAAALGPTASTGYSRGAISWPGE